MEFSGAAEGLDYNDEALKDLFNSALDEPLSWWSMRGLDHLTFGEFVEALARSPAKVAGVPQVVGDKAAAPPVAADGAAVPLLVARSVPGAHGVPSRVRSVPGAHAVHSVPGAHTVHSRARSVLGADAVHSRARSAP